MGSSIIANPGSLLGRNHREPFSAETRRTAHWLLGPKAGIAHLFNLPIALLWEPVLPFAFGPTHLGAGLSTGEPVGVSKRFV
jgi:hypothetical protein